MQSAYVQIILLLTSFCRCFNLKLIVYVMSFGQMSEEAESDKSNVAGGASPNQESTSEPDMVSN